MSDLSSEPDPISTEMKGKMSILCKQIYWVNFILVRHISKSYYQYPAFMRLLDMCIIF